MKRALRLRTTRTALIAAGAIALALAPSPLLGSYGVESALVLGLLLPPFAAAIGARYVAAVRQQGVYERASRLLARPAGASLVVLAVPIAILGLNQLRVPVCNPLEGLAFVALGPGVGVVLAAATGVAVSAWLPRPRLATGLAVLLPLVGIGGGIWRFWSSPAIYVYSHFVGWFPGTLYDEGVFVPTPYLGFRALTAGVLLAMGLVLSATWDPGTHRVRLGRLLGAPARTAGVLALLTMVVVAEGLAPQLGHGASSEHIAQELGMTIEGKRCTVHVPRELPPMEIERLRDDCDYRVRVAEAGLGVRQRERVTAFFFRNASEKQRLMGAAHTYIAKPWRNEVYLQLRGWPHPVLGHEIVHVVAASTAAGPFRIGGHFGGWLPDPALIEGVAVAVAWDVRDGMTPHQWARAMDALQLMPSLDQVVGLSFLGQPPRNAYTVAGSFIRYLLDTYGTAPIRKAYRTGAIAQAVGKPLEELEEEWLAHIRAVELPNDALALAQLRFSSQSIFSAVCPHEVAQLRHALSEDLAAGDALRAQSTCSEILDIDPADALSRARCVGANAWVGAWDAALAHLQVLSSDPPAPAPVRVLARQKLADAAWRLGNTEEALRIYRALLEAPQTDADRRQIQVRALGLAEGGAQASLIFDILIGRDGVPAAPAVAVHIATALTALRQDGLGPYLAARQLVHAGRTDLALPLLQSAQARGLPTLELREEARRLEAVAYFSADEPGGSARIWRQILRDPESSLAEQVEARDWLRRIRLAAEPLANLPGRHI